MEELPTLYIAGVAGIFQDTMFAPVILLNYNIREHKTFEVPAGQRSKG
jgi:hypothetical protein